MAYFLPSYFQKRLLRYALSRLDLLESDALDLENLAFTIGQRSVIELKNVGIRVDKLVERLELPSTISPKHASIRVLRVTIPADLHVSGIEVEVDEIEIEVEIDHAKTENERGTITRGGRQAPSHRDVANRPRIASNTLHDPGGARNGRRHAIEAAHILPTSEDLAASFLEAEPDREKQELQAAVESRSSYLPRSSANLESSEYGTGEPEGFSLPGFVAIFFAGIADRLSVSIRHVTVALTLPIDSTNGGIEPLKFVLKVEELDLLSLKALTAPDAEADPRRSIHVVGIELLSIYDKDILSQKSAAASPRLTKSRSSASQISALDTSAPSTQPSDLGPATLQHSPSITSSRASSDDAQSGRRFHDSMLEASQLFDPSLAHSAHTSSSISPEFSRLSPLATRSDDGHETPPSTSLSPFHTIDSERADTVGLAESKLFSHDEADSMYMSAMSNARMPGGFDDDIEEQMASSTPRPMSTSESTSRPVQQATLPSRSVQASQFMAASQFLTETEAAKSENDSPKAEPVSPNQCAKRILRLNEATFRIPTKAPRSDIDGNVIETRTTRRLDPARRARTAASTRSVMASSHTPDASTQSVYGIPKDQGVVIQDQDSYEVSIGDVELMIDTSQCFVLVKSTAQLLQILKTPDPAPVAVSKKPADIQMKASIRSIVLNVMELVTDVSIETQQQMPTESMFSMRGSDSPLLQLQLLSLQLDLALKAGKLAHTFSIHRLALYREDDKYLSFFDTSSLGESMVGSTMMVEPNDIVVRQIDNRVDVQVKPMHVMLDLLIIDDVLGRSGGLSSLLDLGNSIASTGTIKETKQPVGSAPARRRSVHFDDPSKTPRLESNSDGGLKLNLRIAATVIDLVGSESSMQIKSSAIKVVFRPARLRTTISSVSVRGPIIRSSPASDTLSIRLGDVAFLYLETPEEEDLGRLLELIVPSNEKFEQDDDIMVDTLLRQRRKGGVVRLSVQDVQISAKGLAWTQRLSRLGKEISKLSTVTKYLPEDDRPGILVFALITKFTARLELDKQFGQLVLRTNLLEGAHISVPALSAAKVSSISLSRGKDEHIIHELIPNMQESTIMGPPMIMCRFIPDEMEPTVKLKLSNMCIEYSVPLLLAITQLAETIQKGLTSDTKPMSPQASETSSVSSEPLDLARKTKVSVSLQSTGLSLKPLGSPACGIFLFTDALIGHSSQRNTTLANIDIRKASVMIIDDAAKVGSEAPGADPKLYFDQNDQVLELVKSGFVPVGSISAASANINIIEDKITKKQFIDVEFRNNLFFLETCADSTQTLVQILGGLSPPTPPSTQEKYRMEVVPVQDMISSFTGNAFVSEQGPELGLQVEESGSTPTPSAIFGRSSHRSRQPPPNLTDDDEDDETFMNDLYLSQAEEVEQDKMTESSIMSQSSANSGMSGSMHIAPVNITADEQSDMSSSIVTHSLIDWREGHFAHKETVGGTAHRWDSTQNTYGMSSEAQVRWSPFKVRVRDVHIIWNLFDGYDWQNTRDIISQAVRDVEDKVMAKQKRRDSHRSSGAEEEDESVVGDVLFNSIYISIPTNRDPRELTAAINAELGDWASETGSHATSTTVTAATSKRHSSQRYKPKKLRLSRSKQHKMTFELEGLAADFLVFPPGSGEIESSTDIRVKKLEIFDHIPTSTWKKFATYMHEAGEREVGTDMVHIELLNVKPVPDLAASEIVMKLTVLPLRLHVDQDALDFLTRFFEFKDDRIPPSTAPSNPPFIQRAEVNPIKLRLDFKPKRVDYAGLKSGRMTEFMNFIILDRADMVLRRVILYGVSGFDRLGIMLNNIWTPDVRNNQLPTVLAGLAPVRSLVDVGSGVRDLIAVPIREYKKDGRIVRSIQKGALAFAKTTTTELVNLGAKLAIGTQTALQNAEDVLAPQNKAKAQQRQAQTGYGSDSDESSDGRRQQISHYADQPLGIIAGLRGAYSSLERDLLLAKDAIVAIPGEIMAEGSAAGAAKVVLKNSPTIILRPAIGVSKAVGQAMLGAGNTLDKTNRRRIEDKYKRY